MQSAQREIMPEEQAEAAVHLAETAELERVSAEQLEDFELSSPSLLKQQVAERLAAHRQRRGGAGQSAQGLRVEPSIRPRIALQHAPKRPPQSLQCGPASKQSKIAALVAERYAQSPSYRAFLAEEAERSIQQAAAAAEVAQRNAAAVVIAQRELLAELEQWTAPQEPVQQIAAGGLTVRLYEDAGRPLERPAGIAASRSSAETLDRDEVRALDEEIAFRQAPVFDEYRIEPTVALPANLLEFPRQLIATRKARPRLAEGPLREESTARNPQLRIFEVEPEQISGQPEVILGPPVWTSLWLDAHTVTEPLVDASALAPMDSLASLQAAPLQLRIMAATVDAMLVAGSFVAFCAVAVRLAGEMPAGATAGIAAAGTLAVLYALYQMLFFTLSDQTPGMRYARIGLCTFSDENPTRSAMRRRVLAQLVSLCPLGLGFVWALLDEDRLGWHDRISHMYQRAY